MDTISRHAVRDTIFAECSGEKLDIDFAKVLLLQRAIKALPSVNLWITTYWTTEIEPVVTPFDNKRAAEACARYYRRKGYKVRIDECNIISGYVCDENESESERNCQFCKSYKNEFCDVLDMEPCYPELGCDYFSEREELKKDTIQVLNKIRAKIEKYKATINKAISEDESKIEGMKEAYADCLELIDECEKESEGKE